jgi:hypothetical protein
MENLNVTIYLLAMLIVSSFGANEYRNKPHDYGGRVELFAWCLVASIPYLNVLLALACTLFIVSTFILNLIRDYR